MATRKSIKINIPKYFMAVRNCINILVLYVLEVRTAVSCSYIGKLRHDRKLKCVNKPLILLILILGVLF